MDIENLLLGDPKMYANNKAPFVPGKPSHDGDVHVLTDQGHKAWAMRHKGTWVDCVNMIPIERYIGKVVGWREDVGIDPQYQKELEESADETKKSIHELALKILGEDKVNEITKEGT
jgi:hypothetical protein